MGTAVSAIAVLAAVTATLSVLTALARVAFGTRAAGLAPTFGAFGSRDQRLHGEPQATTFVAIDELHPNLVALLDDVLGALDSR